MAYEDETVVREAAVNSIINLSRFVDENAIPGLALRLSEKAVFQAKVSSIHIISSTISKSGAHKASMLDKLIKLSEDETPMIRRAISNILGNLIDVLDINEYTKKFLNILEIYCNDDQESVKILCMDALIKVIHKLRTSPELKNTDEYSRLKTLLIKKGIEFASDKAWKVRLNFSQKLPEMCGIASFDDSIEKGLFQNFVSLLNDSEIDVKVVAINSVAVYLKPFVGRVITNDQIKLEIDKQHPPLKKLRMIIEKITTLEGMLQEVETGQHLVKIGWCDFIIAYANLTNEKMLKESENSKILDVVQKFITHIDRYFKNLATIQTNGNNMNEMEIVMFMLEAYYKSLIKLDANERQQIVVGSKDRKLADVVNATKVYKSWRIDQKLYEAYVAIIMSFSNSSPQKTVYDRLLTSFLDGFNDQSWTNRMYCVDQLKNILTVVNDEGWIEETLIKRLDGNVGPMMDYIVRITSLYALRNVITAVTSKKLKNKAATSIEKCLKKDEKVPNVKFAAIKSVLACQDSLDKENLESFKKTIKDFESDPDRDVKEYAKTFRESWAK